MSDDRPPSPETLDPRRILVIRGGALGDLIVTLPAVGALRRRWPEAYVELLGYPRLGAIGHGRGYFDAVRSIDAGPLASFFVPRTVLDPDWMSYIGGFDLIVSYFFDPDRLFATNLERCEGGLLVTGSPKVTTSPAAAQFARPLRKLGLTVDDHIPRLTPTDEDKAAADALLGDDPRPVIAVHPGSGGEVKNWPLDRWAAWIKQRVPAKSDLRWLVVSGESDDDRVRPLVAGWPGEPPLRADRLPLPHLAAVLGRCQLFVGHDSGVTHLAAAAGCPVLALFGPTDPAVWAPQGDDVTVLKAGESLMQLPVEQVDEAFLAAMK